MKTNIIYFDELSSTNKYAKDNIDKLKTYDVIFAHQQTNGYGRRSHQWFHSKGDNIALSAIYKTKLDRVLVGSISMTISVAIFDVLKKYINNVSIKWPNDILINGKKVAGILIESIVYKDSISYVIGAGININNKNFDSSISSKATSLFLETKITYQIDMITNEIVENIYYHMDNLNILFADNYHKYIDNSILIGKTIVYDDLEYVVRTINHDGDLIVFNEISDEIIKSSEIVFLDIYK